MKTITNIMMLLALGAVMSLSGIPACKKDRQDNVFDRPAYDIPLDSNANFQGTHTPVPGTLLLLGSGVAGMALLGWRRRTKR
jgi:hypothetical protein